MTSVDSTLFVEAMTHRWMAFSNVPNVALQETWRIMAETFNAHIAAHLTSQEERWDVLPAPTGSGKSQGLAVYCSLLSAERQLPEVEHPGVLIVTRLKAQANELVESINSLTQDQVAIAYHEDTKATIPAKTLHTYPVLVITHRAYEIGMDKVNQGQEDESNWGYYHAWSLAGRRLVVIDEAMDIVQPSQIDLNAVRFMRGLIPSNIAQQYPDQMGALEALDYHLSWIAQQKENQERIMYRGEVPMVCDMTPLRRTLRSIPTTRFLLCSPGSREHRKLIQPWDTILRDVQATIETWNWYAKKMKEHTLNTARLIIPESIKGAVVLDATANADVVYQVFSKANVVSVPKDARRYDNVTLHVSMGHAVGKNTMTEKAATEVPRLVENLRQILPTERKVFVCCHQAVEPHLIGYKTASGFAAFDVGHWGAIDVENRWQHYDTAVVFGLPYRDSIWAPNVFMALQGIQSDDWLAAEDRPWRDYPDVRKALDLSKLIVNAVQAINRVRCRRVVDAEGNCRPTDVFLLLPNDQNGQDILNGIVREMPGIKVERWSYESGTKSLRKSNYEEMLIRYTKGMESDEPVSHVKNVLGISPSHWDRLAVALKDPNSQLSLSVAEHGVRYVVQGNKSGRGSVAYLVKD